MQEVPSGQTSAPAIHGDELPILIITLLKGIILEESSPALWGSLLKLQTAVRDYVAVLGLQLFLVESEGYAFLRSQTPTNSDSGAADSMPRLMTRRQLSFPVSLILALLRKKLAEMDATGGATRLILSRSEILELVRIFMPDGTNDVKLANKIDAHMSKIVDLGFVRKLKAQSTREDTFEVHRILKSFIDAQWLEEFDTRLQQYQNQLKQASADTDD